MYNVEKFTTKNPDIQVVKSMGIAHALTENYFSDLISIRKDKLNNERKVWFFRRSETFDRDFIELMEQHKTIFEKYNKIETEKGE